MRNVFGIGLGLFVAMGVVTVSTSAFAQGENPPPNGTEPPAPLPPPKGNPPPPPPPAAKVVVEEKKDDGLTDHEKVVGKFGVMYFGVNTQPIGTGSPSAANNLVGQGQVNTPVIGMRYWLQERLGIDAGLGFNFFSSSQSAKNGGTELSADGPAVIAFQVHGGVPLALAYGKHYKFLVVPELNFGYATQTERTQNVAAGAATPPDVHRSGIRFDVGARVGTEIQFGFIGIPELALQASIGLAYRHQMWHYSQDSGAGVPQELSSSRHQNNLGTSVQSDPWALFTNNIAAVYYFP